MDSYRYYYLNEYRFFLFLFIFLIITRLIFTLIPIYNYKSALSRQAFRIFSKYFSLGYILYTCLISFSSLVLP